MRGIIFLAVSLTLASGFSVKQDRNKIVDVGEDKSITDVNKDSTHDDILEAPKTQRSATVEVDARWPSPVPYVLDSSLEMNAKGVTLRAFEQFRLKTCIDFKQRQAEDYYLSVQKLSGCYSYIGRAISGGQELSIGRYCDEISTVEHEFLHALGFFHEQSRYDRDDHVSIAFENIQEGKKYNFRKESEEDSTTSGMPYDYWSVMHYGKDAFTNGNGSTIITKDPRFQDIIGQRLEMSPSDVEELNRYYKCNSTIAFKMSCSFYENDRRCGLKSCSQGNSNGWDSVVSAAGGPTSDHTNLPTGSGERHGQGAGYFMHASTVQGQEGDTATLETRRMHPNRTCHIQCLQFYYYHSGSESDELNIWVREFDGEWDVTGKRRIVGQITGQRTTHWQLHHVSLNASRHFQVEFEVRKGAGRSSGGFSIDDINLSETECPHVTLQIDNFERLLNTSDFGTTITSPRHYSSGGYAYRFGILLYKRYFGAFVQLLSGNNNARLKWPCVNRQVTFQMLDQNPNIQLQMSLQKSITSDRDTDTDGTYYWDNPREIGSPFVGENNETIFAGPMMGRSYFSSAENLKTKAFLKGQSTVFVFSFQDLTPLVDGSTLPCPKVGPVSVSHPPNTEDQGSCTTRILPTPRPTDDSIFGFSPSLVASPILILLFALMQLIP